MHIVIWFINIFLMLMIVGEVAVIVSNSDSPDLEECRNMLSDMFGDCWKDYLLVSIMFECVMVYLLFRIIY